MLLILRPDIDPASSDYQQMLAHLHKLPDIRLQTHQIQGQQQTLTEIYLLGNTARLDRAEIESLAAVERVVRISDEYRILGRHRDRDRVSGFHYNGVDFSQEGFQLFAGLCAVDNRRNVETMMKALHEHGLECTRMGAYKPRTSPYAFQGHGADCLPDLFELAGKYGIKVIAMEVTHEAQVEEIDQTLERLGRPTGVMLQIGTRNTQNFELLKALGRQQRYPILLKRGFGIALNESLNAAEYLASEGNSNVIFCLRGMKSEYGAPHRNLVDFSQVPVVKRLTRMPVCIDPSHSVGRRDRGPDGIEDIQHAAAQGVVAGANLVLVDFHPAPAKALVDGPQALRLDELPLFVEDMQIAREAYLKRRAAHERARPPEPTVAP